MCTSKRAPNTLVSKFTLPPNLVTTRESAEEDQSILDEHVSRVWDSSAHHTPSRSPGRHSPRSKSPDRHHGLPRAPATLPLAYKYGHHKGRKEFGSIISTDSGVHEEHYSHVHHHHHYIHGPKSKHQLEVEAMQCSMSEYGMQGKPAEVFRARSEPGATQRPSRDASKRTATKRSTGSASVVFDSGVSMVGDETVAPVPNMDLAANERYFMTAQLVSVIYT